MKLFRFYDVEDAVVYSLNGGQALHLHNICFDESPLCFRQAVRVRKECIGHLFDQDKVRLVKTAKDVGINVIYIDKEGTNNQHIDFCGKPMCKLLRGFMNRLLFKAEHGDRFQTKKIASILKYLHENFPGTKNWSLL